MNPTTNQQPPQGPNPQPQNATFQPPQVGQIQTAATPHQDPTVSANGAKGRLGFINVMQQQLLEHKAMKAGTHASQKPQDAPGEEKPQETTPSIAKEPDKVPEKPDMTEDPKENEQLTKLTEEVIKLREEVKGKSADKEIDKIKSELEALLQDETDENQK